MLVQQENSLVCVMINVPLDLPKISLMCVFHIIKPNVTMYVYYRIHLSSMCVRPQS